MYIFKIIKYQLYLLQLENYELGRYFVLLLKKGLWPSKRGEQRKDLVWTMKARLLFTLAFLTQLILLAASIYFIIQNGLSVLSILYLVLCIAAVFFYFILYTIYVILLLPIDFFAKQIVVTRARLKVKKLKDLKIIGIAGSYGKTTMKEVLNQVLSEKFKVESTPESVNTPVGIARWVLNKIDESVEIAIVEMGEHYKGDVEQICKIAKPDIAVVTGINEAHLERMKTLNNIVATIFEIVSNTKEAGMVVVNGDDRLVMGNYQKFIWPDHKLQEYKVESIKYKVFDQEKLLWVVEFENIGKLEINLLGEYALGDVDAAIKIAESLGMTNQQIISGVKNIKPVEHRLQPIKSSGDVLVVDDAYNGNPAGVAEAIKVLSRFTSRRKIYITPGLVEMGKNSAEVHKEIGKQLAGVADVVILIKNSVTPWIAEQILNKAKVIWFNTAQEAHAELKNILKPGDVILFQNDWGDQYL